MPLNCHLAIFLKLIRGTPPMVEKRQLDKLTQSACEGKTDTSDDGLDRTMDELNLHKNLEADKQKED